MKSQTLTKAALASANSVNPRVRKNGAARRLRPPISQRIKVLLAAHHPLVRLGIVACLKRQANLKVVGQAADGQEALRKARELAPDVLLTDIDMPHMTGLTLAEALHKELPHIKVLVLSAHINTNLELSCAQSGANGYILKQASPDEFVQAIERVNAGQSFFSPDASRIVLNHSLRSKRQGPNPSDLSNREREVLAHIAGGLCNKEIASRLNIGVRTVETHRERMMRKLDIHNTVGLTRFALAKGLVTIPE